MFISADIFLAVSEIGFGEKKDRLHHVIEDFCQTSPCLQLPITFTFESRGNKQMQSG